MATSKLRLKTMPTFALEKQTHLEQKQTRFILTLPVASAVLYNIIVYTNNQWAPGDVLVDYGYTKVKEYLLMLPSQDYFTTKDQLQQQSLAHQQQLLQLQQQLDTERMRRSMALQLDKLQESSANISTGNIIMK